MAGRRVNGMALLLAAGAAAGCAPDCSPTAVPARPNIVLLTVDTLRADHLGCYGSTAVRTPVLDRLAREGALFEQCYAQTHVTVPSHLTILSSLPLVQHGVLANDGRLTRPIELLPQIFARAGYRTAAVVSAQHLGPEFAVGSTLTSLELYDAPRRASQPYRAEETNRRVLRWIRGACRDPLFVWMHYWDPHMPYAPPPPFDTRYYDDDPYDPRHESMRDVELAWHFYDLTGVRRLLKPRGAEVQALERELGLRWRDLRELILYPRELDMYAKDPVAEKKLRRRLESLASFLRSRLPLEPHLAAWLAEVRDIRFPRAQYAGEVSYVDHQVGQLRGEIERLGIAGRTILVVTADHGEALGEHGIFFDHAALYEQSLRVPLIIWAPGRVRPRRYAGAARGLDVAPTLLALAGLPAPPAMQGRDLFAPPALTEPVISEGKRGRQLMIHDGRWKLIRTLVSFNDGASFARYAGTTELYDLRNDPDELIDLAAARPRVVELLGRGMDAWIAARRRAEGADAVATTPLSREQLETLRALGYVE